jgi:prefoldin subunit 5
MDRYSLLFSIDEDDNKIIIHLGNGVSIAFSSLNDYDNFIEQMQHARKEIKANLDE